MRIAIRLASTTGCHIFINGDLVRGDKKTRFYLQIMKQVKGYLKKASLDFFLQQDCLGLGYLLHF